MWLNRIISVGIWVVVSGGVAAVALLVVVTVYFETLERQGKGLIGGRPHSAQEQTRWHAHRTPQWSLDGRVIVTQMNNAIYAVTASGEELWQIPRRKWRLAFWKEDPVQYSPTLSRTGQVAYFEESGDDLLRIKTVNIDGRSERTLDLVPKLRPSIAWAPDGDWLAFVTDSYDPRGARIIIEDLDGAPYTELIVPDGGLRFTHNHQAIEWSSKDDLAVLWGDRRAVTLNRIGDTEYTFIEGGDEGIRSGSVFSPTWSPDGQYLYYARLRPLEFGMALDVVKVDAATLDNHSVLTLDPVAERGIGAKEEPRGLKTSPAGNQLLLVTSRYLYGDRWQDEIYVVNADGSDLRNVLWPPKDLDAVNPSLLTASQALHAAWSPDGSRIAVHNSAPGARIVLYTIQPDGSDVRMLLCRTSGNEPLLGCHR